MIITSIKFIFERDPSYKKKKTDSFNTAPIKLIKDSEKMDPNVMYRFYCYKNTS